ncbi:MAG: sigma 54-interacting transcriptional regulator [Spirochaetales bacterium]|nr:sigma 54-interacting transcriptional regulator [Spirochaetales bacterium]
MRCILLYTETMSIHPDEFFKEVSVIITGHLDIRTGLREAFLYIRRHIPADALYLEIFSMDQGIARIYASADVEGARKPDTVIHLPPQAARHLIPALKAPDVVHVINDVDENPIGSLINAAIGRRENSVLACPLYIETHVFGGLIIERHKRNGYSREDAELAKILIKPFSIALANCLKHDEILRLNEIIQNDRRFLQEEIRHLTGDTIIGADGGLKKVMEKVHQVAATDSPVLILGETGVGKDLIAGEIHRLSLRKQHPFITVNSGAIPESLIDSELFGHEKGAFTGADSRKRGRFERAQGGSLFLDEIGELPMSAQIRLLRVLQNREYERVGGVEVLSADVRLIAATHKDIASMVSDGSFRQDLWFRIHVFPIIVPPLRERREDIPSLVNHFIRRKSVTLRKVKAPEMDSASLQNFLEYAWPGNVRELENVIEHAMILHREGPLTVGPEYFDPGLSIPSKADTKDPSGELPSLEAYTAAYIRRVLSLTRGKIHGPGGAAAILGLKPTTLRYKMDKLRIEYRKKML